MNKQNKINIYQHKKTELEDALKIHGLELRKDSSLCFGYITGNINKSWTLNKIVERMCQMKYLFEYCDLNKAYNEAYITIGDMIKNGKDVDISTFDMAEEIVLKQLGGQYPNSWPWMNKVIEKNELAS